MLYSSNEVCKVCTKECTPHKLKCANTGYMRTIWQRCFLRSKLLCKYSKVASQLFSIIIFTCHHPTHRWGWAVGAQTPHERAMACQIYFSQRSTTLPLFTQRAQIDTLSKHWTCGIPPIWITVLCCLNISVFEGLSHFSSLYNVEQT